MLLISIDATGSTENTSFLAEPDEHALHHCVSLPSTYMYILPAFIKVCSLYDNATKGNLFYLIFWDVQAITNLYRLGCLSYLKWTSQSTPKQRRVNLLLDPKLWFIIAFQDLHTDAMLTATVKLDISSACKR